MEINGAILEVIALTRGEILKNGVSVQTQLAEGLPLIQGDRVQLQQVILNLIVNAVHALSEGSQEPREFNQYLDEWVNWRARLCTRFRAKYMP